MRRSARALLFDGRGRVVLIRRTRPGREPYWVLPGGGVEPGDADHRAAVARELVEELGAVAAIGEQVFLASEAVAGGVLVAHVHLARLLGMDFDARTDDEPTDPSYGKFAPDVVALHDLPRLDLRPPGLAGWVVANALALGVDAAAL
ncbi:8-oxo-dGTP pyrophosphatase MutT, NUDIX family [Actinosynnema pretiosum]|nr:8-oxo-dGTP pyrophosphatase MutT, NUDIX family [Actinosynnema pretiosum]